MNSTLRSSLPIVTTSFVNKMGNIGLSLIPMLVIEKGLTPFQSTMVVGCVKASLIFGTYLGGWMSDHWGLRLTVLSSFLFTAMGLGLLPITDHIIMIAACAVIAQVAHALFASSARLMLSEMLPAEKLQEGIGWFRTANNAGQIVSYGAGAVFYYLGTKFFFFLDAGTALLAWLIGLKIIPNIKPKKSTTKEEITTRKIFTRDIYKNDKIFVFVIASLASSVVWMAIETVQIGVSAKSKILFGADGLKVYSTFWVINTILCTLLAVPATRFIKNSKKAFITGTILLGVGGILSLHNAPTKTVLFVGSFFVTAGEIIFASVSQYTLLTLTPSQNQKGAFYSISMILQRFGVIAAGFLTLPAVVYGNYAIPLFSILAVIGITLVLKMDRLVTDRGIRDRLGLR